MQKRFGYSTSKREIRDILKAWIVISLAFAIVLGGVSLSFGFLYFLLISAVTVGVGFLLHELAHKVVAQNYGLKAEFRSFDNMLALALLMSFFGFIFAAPGAVMISGRVMIGQYGRIAVAGPITNLFLALFFLGIFFISPPLLIQQIAQYGFFINSWLAFFNMIPVWQLDGKKVLEWNKPVYFLVAAVAFLFLMMQKTVGMPGF